MKNRTIKQLEVNTEREFFTFNRGLYTIPKEAVNFHYDPKHPGDTWPELYYIENNPTPVNATNTDTAGFLNSVVLKNALQQVSAQPSEFMSVIYDYARNPSKLIFAAFALIILLSFLSGLF